MSPSVQGAQIVQSTKQFDQTNGGGGSFIHPASLPVPTGPALFWRVGPGKIRLINLQRSGGFGIFLTITSRINSACLSKAPMSSSASYASTLSGETRARTSGRSRMASMVLQDYAIQSERDNEFLPVIMESRAHRARKSLHFLGDLPTNS